MNYNLANYYDNVAPEIGTLEPEVKRKRGKKRGRKEMERDDDSDVYQPSDTETIQQAKTPKEEVFRAPVEPVRASNIQVDSAPVAARMRREQMTLEKYWK